MELRFSLEGTDASTGELRSLRGWLAQEDELRGTVRPAETPPDQDRLGPVLDALEVVATPAAGVLTAALVAWLRGRVGDVRLVISPKAGARVELSAKNVRSLNAGELTALADRLERIARTGNDDH